MYLNNKHAHLVSIRPFAVPCIARDGSWGSAGGMALKVALANDSIDEVNELLESMDVLGLYSALNDAGLSVSPGVVDKGHWALLASVQETLQEMIDKRDMGVEAEAVTPLVSRTVSQPQALADVAKFNGDVAAAKEIQQTMFSQQVTVDFVGDAQISARSSLLFLAHQALQKNIQGFSFDGIAGKYELPVRMSVVNELHRDAASAFASESVRIALGKWVVGNKIEDISELVPDSIQRLLRSSVSLSSASAIVKSIESGMIDKHAGEIGLHRFSRLMADQGFDVEAKSVEVQAEEMALIIVKPNLKRDEFIGTVVGLDHRAGLIKWSRDKCVEVPFIALAKGQDRPVMGETAKIKFADGITTVSFAKRVAVAGVAR